MTKLLLASAATIALMTGVAAAQTAVETTRTTVSPAPPSVTVITPTPIAPAPGYTSTTERSSFGGASVETQKTYQNGPDGTVATSSEKVVRPDGSSQATTHKEWSSSSMPPAPPVMPPASSSTTTTTTIR